MKPLDEDLLHEVGQKFTRVLTIEDGVRNGGMGSAVLEFLCDHGYKPCVMRLGLPDAFVQHGPVNDLYAICGLDEKGIFSSITQIMNL